MRENLFMMFVFSLIAILFFGIMFFVLMSDSPADIQPGDEVVVLSGQTVLIDGSPCQENKSGFVSFTSQEGTQSWYKPSSWFYPTHQLISVIYTDGTIEWVNSNLVVIPSAEYQLCPSQ